MRCISQGVWFKCSDADIEHLQEFDLESIECDSYLCLYVRNYEDTPEDILDALPPNLAVCDRRAGNPGPLVDLASENGKDSDDDQEAPPAEDAGSAQPLAAEVVAQIVERSGSLPVAKLGADVAIKRVIARERRARLERTKRETEDKRVREQDPTSMSQ